LAFLNGKNNKNFQLLEGVLHPPIPRQAANEHVFTLIEDKFQKQGA
jgi:hypothetical protein